MARRNDSDEAYVIDICDRVLSRTAVRQARFDFLRGDSRMAGKGKGISLPCDAYYPDLKLVIEYHERQHTEKVPLFDRKKTISGVDRGVQRKLYDDRRRELLPANGITLVIFDISEFDCRSGKRLARNLQADEQILRHRLSEYYRNCN